MPHCGNFDWVAPEKILSILNFDAPLNTELSDLSELRKLPESALRK
jgi:hypothetical protein